MDKNYVTDSNISHGTYVKFQEAGWERKKHK